MLPSQRYREYCLNHQLSEDPAQQEILRELDRIQQQLTGRTARAPFWQRLFAKHGNSVRGLYLWGGVGRGKTMLMDMLYESSASDIRLRHHFHHFMLQIHRQLKQIKKTRDPLPRIAESIAERTRLLCLDEFHVNDITDAMLLGGLLRALFNHGVTLVTTSNIHPDQLYAGGLQRARFLPAIKLLKTHTEVVELAHPTDYRLQTLRREGTYHYPLTAGNAAQMASAFATLSSHVQWNERDIDINGRRLPVLGQAEGTVWFDFKTLCDSPRSQNDYIEIARQHHSVLLSDVPALNDEHNDAARRLLNLLDIFYDARIKLVVSAATPIDAIYSGERLSFEFQRATSRLIEMQSEEYLSQTHRV